MNKIIMQIVFRDKNGKEIGNAEAEKKGVTLIFGSQNPVNIIGFVLCNDANFAHGKGPSDVVTATLVLSYSDPDEKGQIVKLGPELTPVTSCYTGIQKVIVSGCSVPIISTYKKGMIFMLK